MAHFSPYSIYLNCRNHQLALCLVHLVKQFSELLNLDKLLISTWKLFKYSSIKNSIFFEAQEAMKLKPLNNLKAYTTSWLTHGESCICIISRYEALIAALDEIYTKTHDPETKGVTDLLFTSKNILMILILAEVLSLSIDSVSFYRREISILAVFITKSMNFLNS